MYTESTVCGATSGAADTPDSWRFNVSISVKGRATMALYSSSSSIECHRVRFVLAEKGINVEIIDVDSDPRLRPKTWPT